MFVLLSQVGLAAIKIDIAELKDLLEKTMRTWGGTWSKEKRRDWDASLAEASSAAELRSLLLELEEEIRASQKADDICDADGLSIQQQRQRQQMEEEGWVFFRDDKEALNSNPSPQDAGVAVACSEDDGSAYLGAKVRRFYADFGKSDGVVQAFLPGSRNDGVALWHMVHEDGDEEDLDQMELMRALRAFDANLQEEDNSERGDREGDAEEMDVDDGGNVAADDEEDDDVTDEEEEVVDAGEEETHSRLWPTLSTRERWRSAVNDVTTTYELALALSNLIDYAKAFGAVDLARLPPRSGSRRSPRRSEAIWGSPDDVLPTQTKNDDKRSQKTEPSRKEETGNSMSLQKRKFNRRLSHRSVAGKAAIAKRSRARAAKRQREGIHAESVDRVVRPRRSNISYD